jgi:hypothetical protein
MDTPEVEPGEPESPSPLPPTSREALRRIVERWWNRVRASSVRLWKSATAHPAFRWAGIALGGALSVVVIASAILLVQPRPESLDGFIERFNAAVEKNDEAAFDTLVNAAVFDENPTAYLRGIEFVRKLNTDGKQIAPLEVPANPNTNAILVAADADYQDDNHVLLGFDQGDERLMFRLERAGWNRRWRINDVSVTAPAPTEATTKTADVAEADATESSPEVMAAGFGVGGNGTPLDTEFKLKQILEAWRAAWENKEIDAYMAWYADYATIRRVTVVDGREIPETLTKGQLRSRMERLARTYTNIKINISNVTVQGDYAEAGINFLQEYTAKKPDGDEQVLYQDVGIKNLKFVNDQGEWKIHDEDWRSYVNVPQYPIK